MIVLRKTMDAAIEAEQQRAAAERTAFYQQYGEALRQVTALQKQMSAWVMNEADNITPEQMAAMFWAQDNRWQAMFFNSLQATAKASFEALPPVRPGEFRFGPGVPYGESQWCWMADSLDDSGFETIEAMYEHAKSARRSCVKCGAKPVRDTLDGDDLCQSCCDAWSKAEGQAVA